MAAKNGRTGAIVLPPEQWELLKKVSLHRAMTGQKQRTSVSEVLRDLIRDNEQKFKDEIRRTYGSTY